MQRRYLESNPARQRPSSLGPPRMLLIIIYGLASTKTATSYPPRADDSRPVRSSAFSSRNPVSACCSAGLPTKAVRCRGSGCSAATLKSNFPIKTLCEMHGADVETDDQARRLRLWLRCVRTFTLALASETVLAISGQCDGGQLSGQDHARNRLR